MFSHIITNIITEHYDTIIRLHRYQQLDTDDDTELDTGEEWHNSIITHHQLHTCESWSFVTVTPVILYQATTLTQHRNMNPDIWRHRVALAHDQPRKKEFNSKFINKDVDFLFPSVFSKPVNFYKRSKV